ncbi:von willebrand factor type a domain protein [Ichthyophthirius multifiliis]|uniref:von willebrand factor type a domain protein n=1 Tax=Ichthyophthirius multifiliis TaxID=5932 RepID=G0QP70_ICHMU|nr:von willebrand factor type a domain protein [Ichthyophthirius multifiliis]EGR33000.1 von willebrand factor type a domain protein [Ichthyophthirius multifiliis]|eukprot:XP_004036986.1 von willebrand factor type a domain protein [Ichthyophthirius multifiliis]
MDDIEEQLKQLQLSIQNAPDDIKMAIQGKKQILQQGLVSISTTNKADYIRISIETPDLDERNPCDVVCVLDISGSMATEAQVKNATSDIKESHGLSYLDLLKHAVKTTITNLDEKDRFCLISYSDDARVEFKLDYMIEQNKNLAITATENLRDEGSTNIWAGLNCALDILKNNEIKSQHQAIILLTDGEPNVFPPSGLIPQLEKYKSKNKNLPQINTFALGKAINTDLLDSYANIGEGQYCFIPCPGFIGTIFVNSLSNILTTTVSKCELSINTLNGCKIEKILGGINLINNTTICMGDIKQGQPRDCLLKMKFPDGLREQSLPFMDLQVKYFDYKTQGLKIGEVKDVTLLQNEDPLIDASYCRLTFCERVKDAVQKMKDKKQEQAQKIIADLKLEFQDILKQLEDQENIIKDKEEKQYWLFRNRQAQKFIRNIIKDVEKEVTLAVKREESFKHWGQHFLPSLIHCHLKQQCNNFMDPGIQGYGGKFFQQIKDQVEETFLKLPPPKPSKKQQENNNQQQMQVKLNDQQQQQDQIDMNQYYNCGGGCFEGNCLVYMFDNSFVKVKDVRKGFKIKAQDGQIHTVIAVIKILFEHGQIPLVQLKEGLLITPRHPILINGKWIKPDQIEKAQLIKCDSVYNFVLDKGHNILINNVTCTTFGHGFKGENVHHDYFGTNKIISDLKKLKGFQNGFVEIYNKQFLRDQFSQKTYGLKDIE